MSVLPGGGRIALMAGRAASLKARVVGNKTTDGGKLFHIRTERWKNEYLQASVDGDRIWYFNWWSFRDMYEAGTTQSGKLMLTR